MFNYFFFPNIGQILWASILDKKEQQSGLIKVYSGIPYILTRKPLIVLDYYNLVVFINEQWKKTNIFIFYIWNPFLG